jgi:predicted TPR repeat methyltransferase
VKPFWPRCLRSFPNVRALELDESLYNVWFNIANAQLKLGEADAAVQSLQKTLTLNPDVTAAR